MKLNELTISEARQALLKKEFSALELTQAFLDRIKERNGKINAVLSLCEEKAVLKAKEIDQFISKRIELPVLAGIPCLIKDNILVKDVKCTAGSKILQNYTACYDASVVRKLKNYGAIILGKANLDEFAIGSSGEHSAFGKTLNPHDPERVPGGSSSGPAAGLADNQCLFSLGSDTGGSIRLPASFCGVVGFKPTYGAVSRYGLVAMASSLDQIGPFAKNIEDAKTVFEAIAGPDKMDSTSYKEEIEHFSIKDPKDLVLGVPKEYFNLSGKSSSGEETGLSPEIEGRLKESIEKLRNIGIKIKEVSLPHVRYALAVYYIIMPSEVSANLARYDGMKYGYSASGGDKSEVKDLIDVYLKTRSEGFGKEVKRRIMLGTYSLSAGYHEAYYVKAQKVRTLIKNDFKNAFKEVDAILAPSSSVLPFKFGEKMKDPLSMYLLDTFMIPANLTGLPAISVPAGNINNLPAGIQIIGKEFEDFKILEIANIFEKL